MTWSARGLVSMALAASVSAVMTGCVTADVTGSLAAESERAAPGSCDRFDSFSGQLQVGDPALTRPTVVPGDRPLEPGEVVPPVIHPVLESVELGDGNTVVLAVSGDGAIGWSARFVQEPRLRATDAIVPIAGSCILQIDLSGVETGATWHGSVLPVRRSPGGDATAVVEVLSYPSSATIAQSYLGTRTSTPTVTVEPFPEAGTLTIKVKAEDR
jgi:hypothetical protein